MSTTTSNGMLRLAPAKWTAVLKEFIAAEATKKEATKAATAAENAFKALKGRILLELGDHKAATCGAMVISVKEGATSEPTVTLTTGKVLKLTDITSILVGNETIPGRDIAKVYGGRENSPAISVTGG